MKPNIGKTILGGLAGTVVMTAMEICTSFGAPEAKPELVQISNAASLQVTEFLPFPTVLLRAGVVHHGESL